MNYNVELRRKLQQFIDELQKKPIKDIRYAKFSGSAEEALNLCEQYANAPERSFLAQSEFYGALHEALVQYRQRIINAKSLWRRIYDFFFDSSRVQHLQNASKKINGFLKKASKQHDSYRYPDFFHRALRFFGFKSKDYYKRDHYNDYEVREQLTYLSHHLMGDTDLNHHDVLQGKTSGDAYSHFINDLDEFIDISKGSLDKETIQRLCAVKNQYSRGLDLASEYSWLLSSDLLNNNATRDEFVFDFAYLIKKMITELAPGEMLILPHGYLGHATVIECKRINEQELIFKFINTGSGEKDVESYRTIFKSIIISNLNVRPIKVTSPFNINEVIGSDFIERLIIPVIDVNASDVNLMNKPLLDLYYAGKLHDDTHYQTLQKNGTCAHSSLVAWFKTQVPEPVFLLFHSFILQKAQQRLTRFAKTYDHGNYSDLPPGVLNDLINAGTKTTALALATLGKSKENIKSEQTVLQSELSSLLGKKGKTKPGNMDFRAYYQKKLQGNKLSEMERAQILRSNPLESCVKSTDLLTKALNFFFQPTPGNAENKLSDRAQKAIIAKQIAGHKAFLDAEKSILSP